MPKIESAKVSKGGKAPASKRVAGVEDIDLEKYAHSSDELPYEKDPTRLSPEAKGQMMDVGVTVDDRSQRSGTIIQMDHSIVHSLATQEGVEVMGTNEALDRYDWLSDYSWKAVPADTDKYTAHVQLNESNGYFIRALPGSKTVYPIQACLYLAKAGLAQNVHNFVIAEEGSELHIITGCTTSPTSESGLHLGVSEFYIKRGAKVTFTMIHNWTPDIAVRPRTGILVEEDGVFINNYVLMRSVHSLQTNPLARCVGDNAVVTFNSVLIAPPGSSMDVGSRVILDAKGAKTDIISRAITTGGDIIARGYIEGNAPDVKGHLECRGLILGEEGMIHAIPELKGSLAGIDLSHEAAVGKIAEEEVEYLMLRGLTQDEATAAIVRGFLRVDIEGLPPELSQELQRAIEASQEEAM
ncbi:MAG: SufD family Fe-S cluster assembly protein [Chloroflexota bacterium]|nr:SufD family Fe-S cluster assembly protein [Chloroflexota bacterium]